MLTIFAKELHHRRMVLHTALGNTVKKNSHLKDIPQLSKTFRLYSYHAHFLLSDKSQKRVTEGMKD